MRSQAIFLNVTTCLVNLIRDPQILYKTERPCVQGDRTGFSEYFTDSRRPIGPFESGASFSVRSGLRLNKGFAKRYFSWILIQFEIDSYLSFNAKTPLK